MNAAELDRHLIEIRKQKEAEFGTSELDFYLPPLKDLWKPQSNAHWLFAWNPSKWAWDEIDSHISQVRQGQPQILRWNCSNSNIQTGDRAWMVRLGEEPRGIMATGVVVSEPYEAEHYNPELAAEGKTTRFVDLELTDIRDTATDAFVTMNELNDISIDQQKWAPQSSGIQIKPRSAGLLEKAWKAKTRRQPEPARPEQVDTSAQTGLSEPVNKIYFGPPGTGKTHKLNAIKERYTTRQAAVPHEQWLAEQLKPASWFDVIFMCLYDLGKNAKVAEIEAHPFFVNKARAVGRKQHLKQQIWASLQTHTVEDSVTVKYKNRVAPLVFDKESDSRWGLAGAWEEECEDLVQQVQYLKQGAPEQKDQLHYAFVTFHQAYSYEDFVEGIRPVKDQETGELTYNVEPGIFRQICQDALNAPNTRFALFIDEINRGNIAKIFGELITLIEPNKRAVYDDQGRLKGGMELLLPYSKEPFGVPRNLDIYGTMNTADRSIALLDTALRRRFRFEELMPKPKVIMGSSDDGSIDDGEGGSIDLRSLLDTMNRRIRLLLSRDMTLGHSYFMPVKDFDSLRDAFLNQIIPLLQEYFYNDWYRIQLVFRDVEQDNKRVEPQIIVHEELSATDILGFEHDDFDSLVEYRVVDPDKLTPDAIRKIYEAPE